METLLFFLKGLGAGFVVAAPVGPVAVLCVRRTLARGLVSGYATGLGAAIADTFYGVIAVYGVTAVAGLLLDHAFWFRLVGGIVLLVLAARTLFTGPVEAGNRRASDGLGGDFVSALVVTGTNPVTVVAFGVVFASLGLVAAGETADWAGAVIAGVFVGSALWWATLTGAAAIFRSTINHSGLRWINRISAVVILLSAILVLVSAIAPRGPVARFLDLPFG